MVIGGLTYLSTKIDALLYPTVTVATTNTGYIVDNEDDDIQALEKTNGNVEAAVERLVSGIK